MAGPIPTDEEMYKFQDKLEQLGPDETQRRINQKIYGTDSWKIDESNRFILKKNNEKDEMYKSAILSLQKQRNTVAWLAFSISIVALILPLLIKYCCTS